MNNNVCGQLSAEVLAQWAMTLDESPREFYEERAGILQFDAKLSRLDAERQAYQMTLKWLAERDSSSKSSSGENHHENTR